MWEWLNKQLDRSESRISLGFYVYQGFSIMMSIWAAYSAKLSDFNFDAFEWTIVGITTYAALTILGVIILLGWGKFSLYRSQRLLNNSRSKKSTRINTLDREFKREVIHINDLWDFQHQMLDSKTFIECRFSGPMTIAFKGSSVLKGYKLKQCTFLKIVEDTEMSGILGFDNCVFRDCEFDNVTVIFVKKTNDLLDDICKNSDYIEVSGGLVRYAES